MAGLLALTSMVLKRVHDKQPSHEYALVATEMLAQTQLTIAARYQLLLFTAKILRDTIERLESAPEESINRFCNDDMKAVFVNWVIMLQAALTDPSSDEKLNKLTISVALLALEV